MIQSPRVRFAAFVLASIASLLPSCASGDAGMDRSDARPNILIIYGDDVGYADVSAYGGEIRTPNIDALAADGRLFTRAHASSATCTPSRYSLLTGRYPFRNDRAEILPGDAPLLIEPGSLTLPSHLASNGYETAVVGKWHLGLGEGAIDWNHEVKPGPLEIGFGMSYLIPATNDRVPCVYLDGHHVENLDPADPLRVSYEEKIGDWATGTENPDACRYPADRQHSGTIVNGISRIGWQDGGASALWVDEAMADRFTGRAIEFIEQREAADEPWFLFFSLHQPHVPRLPNQRFLGTSGFGLRGDAIVEADWCVGQLTAALDRLGAREDTLVIFTSDNGPVMNDGYNDGALRDRGTHDPSGRYRGGKYTLWEGGTRVPFIVNWPGTVGSGTSDALICQVDLLATLGRVGGAPLSAGARRSTDSLDLADALVGQRGAGRRELVTQGVGGLAIQDDTWKYIAPNPARASFGRGHWSVQKHEGSGNPLGSPAIGAGASLFDLTGDPAEADDVAADHPAIAARMRARLEAILAREGTAP